MDQPKAESVWWTIFCTLCLLGCHFVAIFILAFVLIRIVPECRLLLEDREVELPQITIMVLKLSYAFVNFWYLLVLALPLEGAVYFLLRRTPAKINWLATVVLVLPLMFAILLFALTTIGLQLPLAKLAATETPQEAGDNPPAVERQNPL